jgi:hypothetical protein
MQVLPPDGPELSNWNSTITGRKSLTSTTGMANYGQVCTLPDHGSRYCSTYSISIASTDETVQIRTLSPALDHQKPPPPITHPVGVRCILPLSLTALAESYLLTGAGDVLRVYDMSSLIEPELLNEFDAHWHDITAIRLWVRKGEKDGKTTIEPWIITTSLDATIRKWRLQGKAKHSISGSIRLIGEDLLTQRMAKPTPPPPPPATKGGFAMTAEEEEELAELLDSD